MDTDGLTKDLIMKKTLFQLWCLQEHFIHIPVYVLHSIVGSWLGSTSIFNYCLFQVWPCCFHPPPSKDNQYRYFMDWSLNPQHYKKCFNTPITLLCYAYTVFTSVSLGRSWYFFGCFHWISASSFNPPLWHHILCRWNKFVQNENPILQAGQQETTVHVVLYCASSGPLLSLH